MAGESNSGSLVFTASHEVRFLKAAWKQRAAAHELRPPKVQERPSESAGPEFCSLSMMMTHSTGG